MMKDLSIIRLFSILLISFSSCSSKHQKNVATAGTIVDTEKAGEISGQPVKFDDAKILKTVYVTDRNGIEMKQDPNLSSAALGRYDYGDKLDIIEIKDSWLGVMSRLTRDYKKNGKDWSTTRWEKVYVQAEKTGELSLIKLIPDDLNIVSSITKNDKIENFEKGKALDDYLKIELITKQEFESKKKTRISSFVADTDKTRKKDGVIELPCDNMIKRYIDKPDAEDQTEVYSYLGYIPIINKYILTGSYYEDSDYKLVDKATGKETGLEDYPRISGDKRYLVTVNASVYDDTGNITLYSISGNEIKPIIQASYKNWMPFSDKEIFWCSDGCLYVSVIHAQVSSNTDEPLKDNYCQYVKIRVL